MSTALTPELVSSLWGPEDCQLSPDGGLVAWVASPNGAEGKHPESGIWVAPVDGSSAARRWTHGAEDTTPRWSPEGGRLAFLSDRAERGTHGLYVLDLSGGEASPLVVRKRSVAAFAWAPSGERLAFLAPDEPTDEDDRREKERDDADVYGERWHHQHLWFVDACGRDPEPGWAPGRHLTEVAWSPDGSRLALMGRDTPLLEHVDTNRVLTFTPGDADGQTICSAPLGDTLGWSGSATLVYSGPHDVEPQSSSTVWAVPADGGEPRVVGTGRDEPRCTIGLCHPTGDGRHLLAVAEGLDTRLEWVDITTGERTIAADVSGEIDGLAACHGPRGSVVALVHLHDHLVGRVLSGPPDALRTLSDHADDVADGKLAGVEALRCTAADGVELDAAVIRPLDAGEGPWPTAVLVHGGPYGRAGLWSHLHPLDWGQLLAAHGFAVVLPNYRGGYGHGNAFATSVRGDLGGAEWGDVCSIVDAAVDAGIADPDRLGIGGWSQGGFLTAWAVTQTDRFKGAVMGAGVSDWGLMSETGDLPGFEAALAGSHPWDGPGPHRAAERSPISYAANRTTPLLILHGADDKRVPLSQAVAFRRALAGQSAPLEMVTYPREPHGVRERRHQIDLQQRVLDWFDRYVR